MKKNNAFRRAAALMAALSITVSLAAPAFADTYYIDYGDITITKNEDGSQTIQQGTEKWTDKAGEETVITTSNTVITTLESDLEGPAAEDSGFGPVAEDNYQPAQPESTEEPKGADQPESAEEPKSADQHESAEQAQPQQAAPAAAPAGSTPVNKKDDGFWGNTITVINNFVDKALNLTLKDVKIDVSDTGDDLFEFDDTQRGKAALSVQGKGNVEIELDGNNELKSGKGRAGLEKTSTGTLTLKDDKEAGSLTATGGTSAAGIGGGFQGNGENITITGGTVNTTGGENGGAGIGGGFQGNGENITITGGTVNATGGGAGIGGGNGGDNGNGGVGNNITITGGTVTATGGFNAAGIGGGINGKGENITIKGGTVNATGGESGAGIGGGSNNSGGGGNGKNITITGGTVNAAGGVTAAGIGGGGNGGSGENITINGGTVNATGGDVAAGIGGGVNGNGNNITITGGTVNATGSEGGAGIGGGTGGGMGGSGNNITITGGTVTAAGGSLGAGIGGGQYGNGENITIKGGTVNAAGGEGGAGIGGGENGNGENITIKGGKVTAAGGERGAGIGGGENGNGDRITITGGVVNAAGGGGGAGIGGGTEGSGSKVTVSGAAQVTTTAGKSDDMHGAGATIGSGGNRTLGGELVDGKEIQADISHLTPGYIHHILYNRDGTTIKREWWEPVRTPLDGKSLDLHVETLKGAPLPFNIRQQGSTLRVTTDNLSARLHGTRQALETLQEQGVEQIQFVTTLKTTTLSVAELLAEGGSWFALEHDGLASRRLSAAQAESLKCWRH